MENIVIKERLASLRRAMKDNHITCYMMPTSDYHNSEYVGDYFKVREYFSNFSGSNGTLVVKEEEAGLWTDGRYFIQAENELEGTGVTLYRMQEEGVPTISEYLNKTLAKGDTLGFDGRVFDSNFGKKTEKELKEKGVAIKFDKDLADEVWTGRPKLPQGKVTVLPEEICGLSAQEKLEKVRAVMKEKGAQALLLSKLDDLMWLLNIRGQDVECNPVALSYGFITLESCYLFIQPEAMTEEAYSYAQRCGITVKKYDEILAFLQEYEYSGKVMYDGRNLNYTLYRAIEAKAQCIDCKNPTELLKAVKNEVELRNMEEVYLRDNVAVTRFIYWLKKSVGTIPLNEYTAAQHLNQLRRETEGFLDLSFSTIAGYKENAAMMHYEATEEKNKVIEPEGMLLVDSGGQYLGGTTDITRTIVLGPVTDEVKKHYSAVAAGMLRLTDAKFLYGCTGRNVDILARQPLWEMGIDYKCGTGHGIGYILNVHEGPQNIRWKYIDGLTEAVLEPGMAMSNEPGVYIEGSHGIRIENIMVVKKEEKNADGQFLRFDTLTYVPIDREALDQAYLRPDDVERINRYHAEVYRRISPYLAPEEEQWLQEATKPL